jgi:general secretion pathway protein K
MKTGERGFALIAVLLVLALLGVVGAEFAYSMRLEASSVRAYKDHVIATHLAEAALAQAIREIVADFDLACMAEDHAVTFYTRDGQPLARLPRQKVPLGAGQFSYTLADEERRLNLNTSPPERIDGLLGALGLDKSVRDVIVDSIQDWRDANEEHRVNGAESEDTYLKLPVPYRARNANLASIAELLQIKGVTPALYHGTAGAESTPGLATQVTVWSPGQVNLNTAEVPVLKALRLSEAEIALVMQTRRDGCFRTPPTTGNFVGRFGVTSRTFRVEAEGLVGERVAARLTAVLQKRSDTSNAPFISILEWSTSD